MLFRAALQGDVVYVVVSFKHMLHYGQPLM